MDTPKFHDTNTFPDHHIISQILSKLDYDDLNKLSEVSTNMFVSCCSFAIMSLRLTFLSNIACSY